MSLNKDRYSYRKRPGPQRDEYDTIEMHRQWRAIFNKYDSDGDGLIPLAKFKTILHEGRSPELNTDLPKEVIEEILQRADWDNDENLSYEEFLRMVHAMELGVARPMFQRLVRFAAFTVVPQKQRAMTVRYYMEEYKCCPPPLFMIIASLVEIGIFIYYCVEMNQVGADVPVPIHSPLIYNPYRRKEAWRYFTYMFIHAGLIHLIFNVLIQLVLGIPLEMVHKWWRIGLVYIAGVIGGSLGSTLSDPGTYLAGASGGVYALIAAHLANLIINYKEMEFAWARLVALIMFAGVDVGVALYSRYQAEEKNKISYAAHFAGALAGLLVGIILLRNIRVHKWEVVLGRVMLAIYILLMSFAIIWNAAYSDFYPVQKV